MLGLIAAFVPEMYHPILIRLQAITLRNEIGDGRWKAPMEVMQRSILQTMISSCYRHFLLLAIEPMCVSLSCYRHFLLLALEPMCVSLGLVSAILLGVLYLFFGNFEIVFADNRHFEFCQIGLTFSGLLVGQLVAISTNLFAQELTSTGPKQRDERRSTWRFRA